MGEQFRVKCAGPDRDLPRAGDGIREPALPLCGEEKLALEKGEGMPQAAEPGPAGQ